LECHRKAACRSDPKRMDDDDYYSIGPTYLTSFFRYFDTCRCEVFCVVISSAAGLKAAGTLMTRPDFPTNSSCRVAPADFSVQYCKGVSATPLPGFSYWSTAQLTLLDMKDSLFTVPQ